MSGPDRARAPVLAATLALAALACWATAGAAAALNLPAVIEHRLAAAQGGGSPETAAWLRSGVLTTNLAGLGALLALLAATAWRRPIRWSAFDTSTPPAWLMPAVIVGLVGLNFAPTLAGGYFRYDDFELLAVARDTDWWTSLWQVHGDHFLPLTRLLFSIAYHAVGVQPLAYNAWLLAIMTGVLIAGDRLLVAERTGLAARLAFAVAFACWSPIAEIMSGYYILSTYLLIAWLGLLVAWAARHAPAEPRIWPAVVIGLGVALAPLVDISGFYVAGIAAVAIAANVLRAGRTAGAWRRERGAIVAWGLGLVLPIVATVYAYTVVNPGTFLAMDGAAPRGPARLLADWLYLVDAGALLTLAVPFVYARLPAVILVALLGLTALLAGAYAIRTWRAAEHSRRVTLAAWVAIAAGIALMVVLGRHDPETVVVRWAAKHVAPVFLWSVLLLALGLDAWWRTASAPARLRLAESTASILVAYVLLQSAVGLLGMAVAFPPFGYAAEIRDADRRRAAVATLHDELRPRLEALTESPVIPPVDGAVLAARWPSLFEYNLSHYAAFLEDGPQRIHWVRHAAMQEWHAASVVTVPDLRRAVSPKFLEAVGTDPILRAYYFAPVALRTHGIKAGTETSSSVQPVDVPHAGQVAISVEPAAAQLVLSVERLGATGAKPVTIEVAFHSAVLGSDWRGTVALDPGVPRLLDLRQVPAFALSSDVSGLRLTFTEPGRYGLRLARPGS